jgi:hypothetical protein
MSTYFSFSLKRYLEHGTFVKLLETKGLKLLRNLKIKWISMLSLMKQVLAEYKIIMVKMHDDLYIYCGRSKDQPPISYDIEVVSMGWLALCLCWKQSMHLSSLHKCVTLSYVICDCCEMCYVELYNMYLDLKEKYDAK